MRTYAYDSYGKVTEIKDYRNLLSDGDKAVKKTYTYDSFDRVAKMVYTDLEHPETVMESYAYSYDKNSNIVEKTQVNNYPQKDEEKVNETKHYTYDSLGRLVKAVTTDHRKDDSKQTVTYTYDKVGNRLAEDKGDTKTTYDYNGLDQVKTSTTWKDGTVQENKQYVYDKNGNEIGQTNGTTGEILYRTYDAENRLTEFSVNKDGKNAVVQQNRYNGDGQRIQRVEGDKTTNYYYQDGVVSYTTDGKGEQTSQDLLGTDGNVIGTQRYTGNDAAYYVYNKDVQGSTTNLVKDDGKADVSYRYEDFGETTSVGENTSGNETCYTGGRYDETTGLYYLNARYYNPEDGRFLSEDTYRGETNEPDTHHLYAYCADNPINYVDPSGHKKYPYKKSIKAIIYMLTCDIVYYAQVKIEKSKKLKVIDKLLYLRGAPLGTKLSNKKYSISYSKDKKTAYLSCRYILTSGIPTPWGTINLTRKLRLIKYRYSVKKGVHKLVSRNL
ncbi:RHS repeat-associated core domain-containing protein [Anaerostipes sp. PC18]|uniref:RHS repeat domain-containing protein n=1 Tax=Anaerostipes sp. PC18 TaxID=3036926 RepID=UPI003088F0F5|nr:RHS repeat-associated core domain-containing protein [Anaerostipes sp. PC18]